MADPRSGFHRPFKVSASLEGQERMIRELLDRAGPEAKAEVHEWMAKRILREARILVPRKMGELESEVQIIRDGSLPTRVGVPASSPAIHKAWATEFGTWNYDVGDPQSPKTSWLTKSKPTAAMPWLRTAALAQRIPILRHLRRYFITGKRARGSLRE